MNIFQYILIIRGKDFSKIKDTIFQLFSSIEKEINLFKTSTIFNLNWTREEINGEVLFKNDEEKEEMIKFMTYINFNEEGLKNLQNYRIELLEYCKLYNSKEIIINDIFTKPGWYDLLFFGMAKNLFNVKNFLYYLKYFQIDEKFAISETVTNLLS